LGGQGFLLTFFFFLSGLLLLQGGLEVPLK